MPAEGLVLILHGNHSICREANGTEHCLLRALQERKCPDGMTWIPNAAGMAWLADTLAAAGMVVAVIDANTTNCVPLPGPVHGRVMLLMEHLRHWRAWGGAGAEPFARQFAGRVDLSNVAVIGHSNGGEAAVLLSDILHRNHFEAALRDVAIGAVVTMAPTDNMLAAADGPALLTMLPSCDQQVSFLDGKRIHDRSLAGRSAPLVELLMVGANHNGFNTSWPLDESTETPPGPRPSACPAARKLSGPVQRRVSELVVASFLHSVLRERAQPEAFMRAEAPLPEAVAAAIGAPVDMRFAYADPVRRVIDGFDGAPRNDFGGENTFEGFDMVTPCFSGDCDREFDHPVWALRLHWKSATAKANFPLLGADLSPWRALSFRATLCMHDDLNPTGLDQDFLIRLVDGAGRTASLRLSEAARLRYPSTLATPQPQAPYRREQLHTIRIPLTRFLARNPALDLRNIASLQCQMGVAGHDHGAMMVAQLEWSQ